MLLIDQEFEYLLIQQSWFVKSEYWAASTYKPKGTLYLHLEIYKAANSLTEIPRGYVVHHKNECSYDNRLENLELMTLSDHISLHHKGKPKPANIERNKSEKMRNLLKGNKYGEGLAGDANGRSIVPDVVWIAALDSLFSGKVKTQAELARELKVQPTQVSYVINGKSRKHLQSRILELKQLYGLS